jgi:hypothetical protein
MTRKQAERSFLISKRLFAGNPELKALFAELKARKIISAQPVSGDILILLAAPEAEQNNYLEPKAELSAADIAVRFNLWYSHYPTRVGKFAAQQAFTKAIRRATFEELLDGLQRYIEIKPDDRSWLNPATWLNQGRWLDDPAEDGGNGQQDRYAARRAQREAAAVADRSDAHAALASLAGMAEPLDARGAGSGGPERDRKVVGLLPRGNGAVRPRAGGGGAGVRR